jgi:hypothetical protein
LFTGVRFLQDANRNMPLEGDTNFDGLKKAYANGIELRGKTLGIIGFGRIGQAVAKMALGLGMKVIAADKFVDKAVVRVDFYNGQFINVEFETESKSNGWSKSALECEGKSEYANGCNAKYPFRVPEVCLLQDTGSEILLSLLFIGTTFDSLWLSSYTSE